MLKENFMVGPFEVRPKSGDRVDISYGHKIMASNIHAPGATRREVEESLEACFDRLHAEFRKRSPTYSINLVRDGELLASFVCAACIVNGMTAGLTDDRAEFWLQSADRLYSMPVSIDEYATLRARYSVSRLAWVRDLLPDEVMTSDAEQWRPPTSWEIRHIVGEGSFSGVSGAKAAALIGMSAQNFRKYTAADGSSTRQNISFAAWHLLLEKLGVSK